MAGRIIIGTANPSLDSNGEIAASSTLTIYDNLTTDLATVYTGIDLLTPLANPLTCDAAGLFPQIWAPSLMAYSVKWSRPGLADITYDNIYVSSDAGQALNYGPEAAVAAAATTDLSTSTANRQRVVGNTAITSFGTGTLLYRILRFTGTPLITRNATTLITPTGANIQAAPGDICTIASDEDGNWTILDYQPFGGVKEANATAVGIGAGGGNITSLSGGNALGPGTWKLSAVGQENGTGAPSNEFFTLGISQNSASFTGCIQGKSRVYGANALAGGGTPQGSAAIPGFNITLTAASTPIYLVAQPRTSSVNYDGYLRAERII